VTPAARGSRRRRVGATLVVAGLLAPLAALGATHTHGEEVTFLARVNDEAEREEARRIRDPRDDVAEIYGVAEPGGAVRSMFLDPARRIVPREDPSRVLYAVDRVRGQTVFLARTFLAYAVVAGVVLLAVGAATLAFRRRVPKADASGPPRG
jgi:hypothetical protein